MAREYDCKKIATSTPLIQIIRPNVARIFRRGANLNSSGKDALNRGMTLIYRKETWAVKTLRSLRTCS